MQHPFIVHFTSVLRFLYVHYSGSSRGPDRFIMDATLENDCLHRRRAKFRATAVEPHDGGFFVQDEYGLVYYIAKDIAAPLQAVITEHNIGALLPGIIEDNIPVQQKNRWHIIPPLNVQVFESVEERFAQTPYLSVQLPEHFFDTPVLLSHNAAAPALPELSDLMGLTTAYLRENEATYGALADELGDWMTHIDVNARTLKVPLSLSCRRALAIAESIRANEHCSIVYMGAGRRMMTHRREHQIRLAELPEELTEKLWEWLKYADLGFAEVDFSTDRATLMAVYSEGIGGTIVRTPEPHWSAHHNPAN